jgi:hypothetical protein
MSASGVVIRWRPGPGDSEQMTDVLGMLEQADAGSFAVRTRDRNLVVIPPAPGRPQASLTGDPLTRHGLFPAAHRRLLTPRVTGPSSEALEAFAASWQDRYFAGGQDSSGCTMSLCEALKTNPGHAGATDSGWSSMCSSHAGIGGAKRGGCHPQRRMAGIGDRDMFVNNHAGVPSPAAVPRTGDRLRHDRPLDR